MKITKEYFYQIESQSMLGLRKAKKRIAKGEIELEIKEVCKNDAPIAFIIENSKKTTEALGTVEMRWYDNKLWTQGIQSIDGEIRFAKAENIKQYIPSTAPYRSKERTEKDFLQLSRRIIIIEDDVYETCEEPVYVIHTPENGRSYGASVYVVSQKFISSERKVFNAFERDKAIRFARKIAYERGGFFSLEAIGIYSNIKVLIPEAVRYPRSSEKVFLGGTCNGSKWREQLIPLLKCDYFNPVVDHWDEEAQKKEFVKRKTCDFVLYVITPKMKGVYSIAEVVDDSNKRPEKTLFCLLSTDVDDDGNVIEFETHQMKALKKVAYMVHDNGGKTFDNISAVADFLNSY